MTLKIGSYMKKIAAAALSLSIMALACSAAHGDRPPGCGVLVDAPLPATLPGDVLSPESQFLTLREGTLRYRLFDASAGGTGEPVMINPYLAGDDGYEETPGRRFEIVFFISTPVTLGLSFAGIAAYKLAAGTWGNFDRTDYVYLALSTISLSLSIAIHDSRVVYKKKGT